MMNAPTLFALCALLLATLEAESRTCRMVFPNRPKEAPQAAYLYDGVKNHQVSLQSMNFSDVVELPEGDLTIALTAEPVGEDKVMPANARQLDVSKEVIDFYIVITADGELKEFPLKLHLLDVSAGKLAMGETAWYNSTAHRIMAELGETRLTVDPNETAVSSKPIAASGYYHAVLTYQVNGEGAFQPLAGQQWWHDQKSRHLGFVSDTGGKLPRVLLFRDFRNP